MPLHPLNFVDWGASVVTTPTLTTNARKCASFSKKSCYPDSAVTTGKHRAQEIDRSRDRTTNVTERKNQLNSIHPPPPSTKPCNQKCLCEIYMKCILYCGYRWKWRVTIALNFQFKQLEGRSLENIKASMGFEPVTSATPVRCTTNWAVRLSWSSICVVVYSTNWAVKLSKSSICVVVWLRSSVGRASHRYRGVQDSNPVEPWYFSGFFLPNA